jgi:hypothetical protein
MHIALGLQLLRRPNPAYLARWPPKLRETGSDDSDARVIAAWHRLRWAQEHGTADLVVEAADLLLAAGVADPPRYVESMRPLGAGLRLIRGGNEEHPGLEPHQRSLPAALVRDCRLPAASAVYSGSRGHRPQLST